MKSFNLNMFVNGTGYEDVNAIVQADKEFSGGLLKWREEFTDNDGVDGVSYQVRVKYDVLYKGVRIDRDLYCKIVCKGGVMDKAEGKLKLKPGDCIRFNGEFKNTKGTARWFKSFEILHPDWIKKIKSLDSKKI